MADVFNLTGYPVRMTATGKQALDLAMDVSAWDDLDALLGVLALEGAGNVTVQIITGMQRESEDGWVPLVAFSNTSSANSWQKVEGTGLLRFIRWQVLALTASAVVFEVRGMLRARG